MVPVKFLRPFGGYNLGEIAAFPDFRSEAMVKAKIAEAVKGQSKSTPKKPKVKACQEQLPETIF